MQSKTGNSAIFMDRMPYRFSTLSPAFKALMFVRPFKASNFSQYLPPLNDGKSVTARGQAQAELASLFHQSRRSFAGIALYK